MYANFESVASVYNYLTDSNLHSTTVSTKSKNQIKTKESKQITGDIQILPKGRVRYGPITVNPRKQPSKTLFTGRRSKYEVLDDNEEEEKRRDRRERNRVAATKCREKRENVLQNLEIQHKNDLNQNKLLIKLVQQLEQRKSELETTIENHFNECLLLNEENNNQNSNVIPTASSMIFGDPSFLSSIPDTLPLPLPNTQILSTTNEQEDEEISHLLDPILTLTNSAYNEEESTNPDAIIQSMTTSSIDRLINTLHTPNISMDSCNNSLVLINSSCAKQHSHSSEDDSLPKCANSYVY